MGPRPGAPPVIWCWSVGQMRGKKTKPATAAHASGSETQVFHAQLTACPIAYITFVTPVHCGSQKLNTSIETAWRTTAAGMEMAG